MHDAAMYIPLQQHPQQQQQQQQRAQAGSTSTGADARAGAGAGAGATPGAVHSSSSSSSDYCSAESGGCIREFPTAEKVYSSTTTTTTAAAATTTVADTDNDSGSGSGRRMKVSETLDIGHRHFSGFHWLYPNTFALALDMGPPGDRWGKGDKQARLLKAAHNTLQSKVANAGGHTGWSVIWESCLWARLGDSQRAMRSLDRFVSRFLAPNLLSLHPPLAPTGNVPCGTCFTESSQESALRVPQKEQRRQSLVAAQHPPQHPQQQQNIPTTPPTPPAHSIAPTVPVPLLSGEELWDLEDVLAAPRGMNTPGESKVRMDCCSATLLY
jgi:hypothetical protein